MNPGSLYQAHQDQHSRVLVELAIEIAEVLKRSGDYKQAFRILRRNINHRDLADKQPFVWATIGSLMKEQSHFEELQCFEQHEVK